MCSSKEAVYTIRSPQLDTLFITWGHTYKSSNILLSDYLRPFEAIPSIGDFN